MNEDEVKYAESDMHLLSTNIAVIELWISTNVGHYDIRQLRHWQMCTFECYGKLNP